MFDQTQSNILDGLLAGDASIPRGQNLPHFSQRAACREYVELVARQLGIPADRVRSRTRKPDRRTGRVYRCSEFRTLSDPIFGLLRRRWYRDGIKAVPSDLKVSREFVLHWFLCDGACSTNRRGAQLMFCTDGFSLEGVDHLRGLLASVGVETSLCEGPRIRVRQNSVNRFFDYVGECPVRCLEYKWVPSENRASRQKDLRPAYEEIYNLYAVAGWSCERIARKFGTNYWSIRYVLKNHFGVSFGKNAVAETTCREGVVAPSETARRAPARRAG